MNKNIYFQQLFEKTSSTYTYLLADKQTKRAILIDPVKETLQRDLNLLQELGFKLEYVLETHVHADHITSAKELREETGAKLVYGKPTGVECADVLLDEGEELQLDSVRLKTYLTPGHTSGDVTYALLDSNEDIQAIFSGDTLLINSCGRTDFQQGSPEDLYESLSKLYNLADETIVYPAHNYEGISYTTIGQQKRFNKFMKENTTKEEFIEAMNNRELPLPKKIKESVPANQDCGEC